MKLLSRSEESILLAIIKLKDNAYGPTILKQIFKDTGQDWAFASIISPLKKLVEKKLVLLTKSGTLNFPGGKSRSMYNITEKGVASLHDLQSVHNTSWKNFAKLVKEL